MNNYSKTQLPSARKNQLIVKEVDGELLVYDLESDQAHCLNESAARVWKSCDGKRTVAQLAEALEKETASPVPEEMVRLALDQLETFKLLQDAPPNAFAMSRLNRRELVKRIGIGTLAVPVIISIAAPNANAATSKSPNGTCCSGNGNCASGNCAPNAACNPTTGKSCQ